MNETKGFTLWFTGLPSSGKTVLADAIAEEFKHRYFKVERLDGDIVRKTLTRDLGFSAEGRRMNIERVTYVAKLLTRNGVIVLSSFITPFNDTRKYSREEIGEFILKRGVPPPLDFLVSTSSSTCCQRVPRCLGWR